MLPAVALFTVFALGAADLTAVNTDSSELPPLHANGSLVSPHAIGRLALRSPLLESSDPRHASDASRSAQRHGSRRGTTTASPSPAPASTAPATTPAESPAPTGAAPSSEPAATASTSPQPSPAPASTTETASPSSAPASAEPSAAPAATDANAAPAEEEPSLELMRHRARLTRTHRPLGITTWASLLVTEVFGTLVALNRATIFGQGACASGTCFGGNAADSPLLAMHQLSAFVTLGFYTSTGIFALSMPDPEHASVGDDHRAGRLRWHKRMAVVHLVGMILQPILGILSLNPGLVGITSGRAVSDFGADVTTIHLGVGYVTFAALTTAMLLELLP